MNNVYATAYNIKKTLSFAETDSNEIGAAIIHDVVLMQDLHLPSFDLTALKTLYLFLEAPSEFLRKYFKGWKDTVRFLIEEPPAYHFNPECEWFLKDFFNVEIPGKIKKRNLVDEARQWTKSNKGLLAPETIDEFSDLFIGHFNGKYDVGLTRDDLKSIDRPNSGQQIVHSQLESVEAEIIRILDLVNQYFTRRQQHFFDNEYRDKKYIYNGEYRKNGAYLENKLYWDLHFWRYSIIKPLHRNTENYIFLKLNKDHKYSQNILDFLKFKHCDAIDCAF